ncbi:MAG TPA: translation initiation factor [Kofleriaceae bacterium]
MTAKRDSPFSSLQKLRDQLPAGPQKVEPVDVKRGPSRAVVRYERKHRGGKEVTVVEKLELKPAELATWCRELKQALGCGGAVEDTSIVLQGDQRSRLPDLLSARGVGKVTVS